MTNPDDRPVGDRPAGDRPADGRPAGDRIGSAERLQGHSERTTSAPSWIDEVLGASSVAAVPPVTAPPAPLSSPGDLKIPPTPSEMQAQARTQAQDRPAPVRHSPNGSGSGAVPSPSGPQSAGPRPYAEAVDDPWSRAATALHTPSAPVASSTAWGEAGPPMSGMTDGNVAQKKLIAGLLAIFLGGLGVHKFYLNMNTPGLVMLATNLGVWVLALVLGLLLFVVGLFVTMPLAGLVSTGLGIVGLIEGIIYLTKSDADFERDYLIGKKPWF